MAVDFPLSRVRRLLFTVLALSTVTGTSSQPDLTTAADAVVTFNEVMYHPGANAPGLEWIELYNQMSIDIELSNWRLEGGIEFRFPPHTILPAGSYVVIAAAPAALQAASGATNVFGPFSGQLSNTGETLRLRNHNGRLMDEFTYADDTPWPVAADGSGASLAKRDPLNASSPAANWRASAQVGGTPGRPNFATPRSSSPPTDPLISANSSSRWLIPADGTLEQNWLLPGFADATWSAGSASLGYDATEAFTNATPAPARTYSLDGNVADLSGNGYDGQNVGGLFSSVVPPAIGSGQSFQFDGVSSYVRVADPINPTAYTLALWVRVDQVRPCSLIVRTADSGPTVHWSHQLRINSAGRFEHYLYDGNLRTVTATNVIQPGTWYHVAATATNGGSMRIYVNGATSGGTVSLGTLWTGGNQWRFGTDSGHTPNYFSGRLDEIGLWHRVLSPADITRLAAGTPPGLLSGYRGCFVTDLRSTLYRTSTCFYLRLPFSFPWGVAYDSLTLRLRYDDGLVAYLNGTEFLRRNAPQNVSWDAAAVTNRTAVAALHEETFELGALLPSLLPGTNLLAIQAFTSASTNSQCLLQAELLARQAPPAPNEIPLGFSEVASADSPAFFMELLNRAPTNLNLAGFYLLSSAGKTCALGSLSLAPGGFTTLTTNQLGCSVQAGDKWFLLGPGQAVVDGVKVSTRLQGKLPSAPTGDWGFPTGPTPGGSNLFQLHDEIVINEILYHAPAGYTTTNSPALLLPNDEQWIELYNRSPQAVDLSGWSLEQAADFLFPSNTVLAPDSYLVVAKQAAALQQKYPGIAVLGDFRGKLSHRGDHIVLRDSFGNVADEVTYLDDLPWPAYADGGGSSLELRDPHSDNTVPESWSASLESSKSSWRHYSYRAYARNPVYAPNLYSFHEFRVGLLDQGEALLDNVSVQELSTNGPPRQLLQNTQFTTGLDKWRLVGNHVHSQLATDPGAPANPVLHLVAGGPMSYLENQLETTLKVAGSIVPVVAGCQYEISFDAKWLAGSPQLHTELYYNKVAATTILDRPDHTGTPGRRNSTWLPNVGPTFTALEQSPVVPGPGSNIVIRVSATDPDGVDHVTLRYAVNGGSWQSVAMALSVPATTYRATIPSQAAGAIIQFYVEGADRLGATAVFPAGGVDSRALTKVDYVTGVPDKQVLRLILTPEEAALLHNFNNLMSDDLLGCTVVHNESEVFYNARIRLHGSMFSRQAPSTTGFTIKFPAEHRFRGSRRSIVVRRSDLVEVISKHILNQAGGLPANYADVIYLISHRTDNVGNATLNLANYDDTYIDSQFENSDDGTAFKLEGIRVYETTDNGTPEGYKLPQPVDFVWGYDITNLGEDPEQYRWSLLIQNQRARDDFSGMVALGKAFSQTTSAGLQQAVPAIIDIDEWARYFALQMLVNVTDIYGFDNPHNIAFYQRSSDGRIVVLQNDWGGAFQGSASGTIYGKNKIFTILKLPIFRRLYQGHLLDLMNSVFNAAYLSRWAQHFTDITGANYNQIPGYAETRNASVRSQLAASIPFTITSNAGADFTVNSPTVALEGRGWIDVYSITLAAQTNALPLTWLDEQRWQISVPLQAGTNRLQLIALNYRGAPVGQAAITISSTVSGFPQRDFFRITELMYHPPPPTPAEVAAGYTDAEDFEFIELRNTGPTNLSLVGVRFTAGVSFDFTGSAITNLGAGQRVLVVAKRPAFACRYGGGLPVAGAYAGHLENAGERLRLVDSFGGVIQEFSYDDSGNWPAAADGQGKSLEVLDVNGDYNNPTLWQASLLDLGTPGAPALVRPAFSSVTVEEGLVHLRFRAAAQQDYSVLVSSAPEAGPWEILSTIPAGDTSRLEEVVDPSPPADPPRFYRLSTP